MPLTIQKPAPDFSATAVMPNGDFKDIKLSDYKGACRGLIRRVPKLESRRGGCLAAT